MLKKSIWLNLFLMLIVAVGGFAAVVWGLDYYTLNGIGVTIPEVRGKQLEEAIRLLDKAELRYEVVDSIYDKTAVPGSVIEAYPSVGETVKPNRIIFLKIYANASPRLTIPYVKDMSARQAYALLRGLGFEHITLKEVAGEYKDLCMGITLADGKPLTAGDLINRDTPLILLVTGAVRVDSIRLEELLAVDSLAEGTPTITRYDSTQRKRREEVPEDEPHNEPENWW